MVTSPLRLAGVRAAAAAVTVTGVDLVQAVESNLARRPSLAGAAYA